jgi:Domain of Unknown Function (DUF1080)
MYRSFICAVVASLIAVIPAAAKEAKELFNGKDLSGWDGDPQVWSVENGAIVGRTKDDKQLTDNTFLIWKVGKVGDFRLTLQYRIDGGNSGVQYRSKVIDPAKWVVGGYQADIDSGTTYSGILYDEKGRGILAERGQRVTYKREGEPEKETFGDASELQKSIKTKDWNEYEIEVRGARMKHTINGKLMSETVDRDPKQARSGVLALQIHKGPPMMVQFRKIRLEVLDAKKMNKEKGQKKKAKAA